MRDLNMATPQSINRFAIFNGTTEENAIKHFYRLGGNDAKPLWSGTPYAEWLEVMPFIADVTHLSAFTEWEAQQAPEDWGILVSSDSTMADALAHFRSLTQVWMPSGSHSFFRFYDPRFSLTVAEFCDDEQRAQVMGPCQTWQAKGKEILNVTPIKHADEKPFPWWNVPKNVVQKITDTDKTTRITNSVKWLRENHADLYFYYPESTLQAKITRLVTRHKEEHGSLNQLLKTSLEKEVYR
ncbi:DUF4123 domain-containing protein [Enterovibrio sp. 27052020O]|uniref:DUF4123 domain-containing protein n=1 Tax=Enterovibrio sp. 27052020O TaxID=3241166 RepID=UPI00388E6498